MEWKPIETAPRDGTDILVYTSGVWPEVVRWEVYEEDTARSLGEEGYWRYSENLLADICGVEESDFSHWMPLPNPPKP